jgi:hypothetical protein
MNSRTVREMFIQILALLLHKTENTMGHAPPPPPPSNWQTAREFTVRAPRESAQNGFQRQLTKEILRSQDFSGAKEGTFKLGPA